MGQATELGVELSPSQAERLLAFEELLRDRGARLGLISRGDVSRVRGRHILDCLRVAPLVDPAARSAYDLGSGGGLPGVVVAIALPHLELVCVEVRRNRAAFLELAIDRLELANASALLGRLESLTQAVDVCFARALAPPEDSWSMAERLLSPGGSLIYFAGRGVEPSPGSADAVGVETKTPSGEPAGVRSRSVRTPGLECAGPLVIMGRP